MKRPTRRLRPALLALLLLLLGRPAVADELFPRPAALEPDVAFWVRIYSEVGTTGGLIHDSRDLGVVYQVLKLPNGTSTRSREKQVEREKKAITAALRKLGQGKRSGLSAEERRILALFPKDVSNRTLASAAKQVRFQLGQADKFRAGLVRSGAWRDYIRRTLAEIGVPTDLSALPHVESSFTPSVYSRVGAAGLWQFTRSTGRRYMRVDHVVDERLDPFRATVAAGRLLEANKLITGTWPLAITAYNHGAAGMRRAARKLGTTDIATIVRKYKSRSFGFASRNFYVEFLAAREVDAHAERYFGALTLNRPIAYQEHELAHFAKASSLANATGVPLNRLREANPALSRMVWSGEKFVPRGFKIRVPKSDLSRPLADAIASIEADQRYASQTPDSTHKVRRGDTLSGIAARYGTTVQNIAAMNKLRSRNRISIGQVLRLPHDGRSPQRAAPVQVVASADGTYRVKRGDSVSSISQAVGLSPEQLVALNGLRNRNRIYPGQTLRVTAAEPPSSAVAKPAEPPVQVAAVRPPPASQTPARAVPKAPPAAPPVAETVAPQVAEPIAEPVAEVVVLASAEPLNVAHAKPPEPEGDAADEAAAGVLAAVSVEADAGELEKELLADPSDYSVAENHTIEVQATETLGHIAEWLDVRASRLRTVNRLRYGTPLAIHQHLALDFSRVEPSEFERRRLEHHRAVQSDYFERFEISGTRPHVVRRGDSLWELSRRSQVPLWLLQQYNPDLDFAALRSGDRVTVPLVRPHKDAA